VAPVRNAGIDTFDDVRSDPGLSDFGWPGLFVSGTSSEGATSMLDEIFELFERDKNRRNGRPTGKRSLLDRVSGMLGDNDRRRYDDDRSRYDERRRYEDDRRDDDVRRYEDDRYREERHARSRYDDDERRRDDDDRYRSSEYRKPSKKKRLADLLDFD
jgi:hypothetical protein